VRITQACWLISVAGMLTVAVLGPSAAVSPVPGRLSWPPYALSAAPADGLVYVIAAIAVVSGATATWRLLTAHPRDPAVGPGWLHGAGFLVAAVLTLLPPFGADVKSYVAYGMEAASGVNPYTAGPQSPGVPQNGITQAVESPWQTTPSVYGPVFTKLSEGIARLAHGDGHVAVTLTRILLTGSFVLTGLLLHALCRTPTARSRAAVMWSANPLLLFTLVGGAHVDVLVTVPLLCSIALVRRFPLAAGAAIGLAATLKLTGLVALPGLVWAARRRRRSSLLVLVGVCAVAVPLIAATPDAFAQLRRASRFTTPAAPWRPVASLVQPVLGYSGARSLVGVLAGIVGLLLIALLLRRGVPPAADTPAGRAAAITAAFAVGWVLTTPYVLPWYDVLAWAPLALVGASFLDRVLLVHTMTLAMAFLPGRTAALTRGADLTNRVLHSGVSPAVLAVLVVVTARLSLQHRNGPRPQRKPAIEFG
jgi:alpha-1,6-mannosyltransferase